MPNETPARRYATAIFALASEAQAVAAVGADLHTFVAALTADADVNKFFRSPVVDRKEKSAVIGEAFSKLHDIALHSILLLIQKRREALAPEIVAQYDRLERLARGAQTLRVTSARPLSKADLDALVAKLAAKCRSTSSKTSIPSSSAAFASRWAISASTEPSRVGSTTSRACSVRIRERRHDQRRRNRRHHQIAHRDLQDRGQRIRSRHRHRSRR
jgi:F-type H+-transporting ATPase subunit delta